MPKKYIISKLCHMRCQNFFRYIALYCKLLNKINENKKTTINSLNFY